MLSSSYKKKIMEDLDALLADLQTSTAHITNRQQGLDQNNSSYSTVQQQQQPQSYPRSETPPPLPPPPQDLLDPIPPPNQFNDQQTYEPQNLGHQRISGSSTGSGTTISSEPNPYFRGPQPYSGPPQGMSKISNNLSELDQLLQDLNSAQFMSEVDKKHSNQIINDNSRGPPPVAPKPGRDRASERAAVDNLLNQLETSAPQTAQDHGGYPVQSGTTNYSYQPSAVQQAQYSRQPASSTATRELDDLMATLSEFKVSGQSQQGMPMAYPQAPVRPRSPSPGSEPSYAKPNKSRNASQSSGQPSSPPPQPIPTEGQLESMLGDLQSDMSRQGVTTKTKGLCAACNQPVVGQVITALGKVWHIEHFTCAHCRETLGTKNFFERDGQAYCEKDYHALFAPRCAYCKGPILDKCVTALGTTWHPEHFFCAQCGRPFGDDGFHEKDGKAFCRPDYFELFAPKCGGCGQPIIDNYISALNRHWHCECFVCWDCHQPFGSGSFFDHEGLPYCETHYHAKKGSLCAGCQKPITGRCITAMYKKFHPEHFVCAFCLKQLNKGTFKEQNDKPYCHPCFVKLFG